MTPIMPSRGGYLNPDQYIMTKKVDKIQTRALKTEPNYRLTQYFIIIIDVSCKLNI